MLFLLKSTNLAKLNPLQISFIRQYRFPMRTSIKFKIRLYIKLMPALLLLKFLSLLNNKLLVIEKSKR